MRLNIKLTINNLPGGKSKHLWVPAEHTNTSTHSKSLFFCLPSPSNIVVNQQKDLAAIFIWPQKGSREKWKDSFDSYISPWCLSSEHFQISIYRMLGQRSDPEWCCHLQMMKHFYDVVHEQSTTDICKKKKTTWKYKSRWYSDPDGCDFRMSPCSFSCLHMVTTNTCSLLESHFLIVCHHRKTETRSETSTHGVVHAGAL